MILGNISDFEGSKLFYFVTKLIIFFKRREIDKTICLYMGFLKIFFIFFGVQQFMLRIIKTRVYV